jgi:phage terminase large subunit-like protein
MSGKIVSNRLTKLMVERHLKDLQHGSERGLWFDEEKGNGSINFFEEILKHSQGKWANTAFILEDFQAFRMWCLFGWQSSATGGRRFKKSYVEIPRKNGKALCLDTPIPTTKGFTELRYLKEGDTIYSGDGAICNVVKKFDVINPLKSYRIKFTNCDFIDCCEDHLWQIYTKDDLKYNKPARVLPTKDLIDRIYQGKIRPELNLSIKRAFDIDCEDKFLPIDPYLLGVWLGDGHSAGSRITVGKDEIDMMQYLSQYSSPTKNHSSYTFTIYGLATALKNQGILNNKNIPEIYFGGSKLQRLELLRGLMDTDGCIGGKYNQAEFCNMNKNLSYGVWRLVCSFGWKAKIIKGRATLNGKDCGTKYRVLFNPDNDNNPFKLERKANKVPDKSTRRDEFYKIVSIEQIENKPMQCIQVDSIDNTFLCGHGYIRTHNSTEAAGAALLAYTMDGESGAQIYAAATKKDQARIVFREAQNMVKSSQDLQEVLKVYAHSIVEKDGAGYFHCLSSDTKSMDGLNIHCATVDELHAHSNRDIMDLIETATSARVQPLIYAITTAGSNRNSICYEHHELVTKVLEGSLIDDSLFGAIYSIDENDDWHDEESWFKANPNLGVSKSIQYMKEQFEKAVNNPTNVNTFLRLDLNVWTDSVTRWVTDDLWMKGGKEINLDKLKGRKCWIGVDLASVSDTTAVAILFEPDENGEQCVLFKCYLPESTLYTGTRAQFHNYHFWARDGFLTMTKGATTDYKKVIADLLVLKELYNIQLVGIDRWNSSNFYNDLYDLGFDCVGFGQGYKSQTPAINGLESLLLDNKLIHGGNPVARWQCGNAMLDNDAAGNKKFNKKKSTEKIDLMAALSTAVGISQEQVQNKIPTITII